MIHLLLSLLCASTHKSLEQHATRSLNRPNRRPSVRCKGNPRVAKLAVMSARSIHCVCLYLCDPMCIYIIILYTSDYIQLYIYNTCTFTNQYDKWNIASARAMRQLLEAKSLNRAAQHALERAMEMGAHPRFPRQIQPLDLIKTAFCCHD